jgi:hypothetical protein
LQLTKGRKKKKEEKMSLTEILTGKISFSFPLPYWLKDRL